MALPPNFQLDALREMINTGLGRAAASLNMMLDVPVDLDVPSIAMFKSEDLPFCRTIFGNEFLSCVQVGFRGPFSGTAFLAFPPQSAARLVATLVGNATAPSVPNGVMADSLNEVGNILINSMIGTIGNILAEPFEFSLPRYLEGKFDDLLLTKIPPDEQSLLLALTRFQTKHLEISGNIFIFFEFGAFEKLLSLIAALPRNEA